MFLFKKVKKAAALCALALAVSAAGAHEYDELIQNGDADAIVNAMHADKKMKKAALGEAKDSLVMAALRWDRPEVVVRALIDSGVKLSYKNKYGQTALTYACAFSSERRVIILVAERSGSQKAVRKQLLKKDKKGLSALDYARKNPERAAFDIISVYLTEKDLNNAAESGESSQTAKKTEDTVLLPAATDAAPETDAASSPPAPPAEETASEETASKEEEISPPPAPLKPLVPPTEGESVAKYKKTYLFDYLPAQTPDAPDAEDETAPRLVKNPDKRDKNGRTALMKAVQAGNDWEMRLLIQSGADVNARDTDGWTALMYAARYQNSLEAVNILIKNGAAVLGANAFGLSALQLAACYNANPDVLKTLLAFYPAGANEIFKAFVLTLSAPQKNHAAEAAKIAAFIERGVPLNRFYEGKTPLMYAAEFGSSTCIIKVLLDNGAETAIRNADGKSAFDYASHNPRLEHDDIYWSLNAR